MNTCLDMLMRWWHVREPAIGETPLSSEEIAHGLRIGVFFGEES